MDKYRYYVNEDDPVDPAVVVVRDDTVAVSIHLKAFGLDRACEIAEQLVKMLNADALE